MRFALKAIPLGLLGCAAALLVACGNRNGLLTSGGASSLQSALARVDSACAGGDPASAQRAAQDFRTQIAALSAQGVDRRLIANLQQGAGTLDALVASTCTTGTGTTTSTPTTPTTTTQTTTTPTTTTDTTTTPTTTTPTDTTTTPTTPTTPTTGGGGTPPSDGGGNGNGNGNGNGPPGGSPPGQANGGAGGGQ